jgi:hypothetical protein
MVGPSLETPDLVLVGVGLSLVLGWLVGAVHSVQIGVAMGASSIPASGTIGYALFFDPPESTV